MAEVSVAGWLVELASVSPLITVATIDVSAD